MRNKTSKKSSSQPRRIYLLPPEVHRDREGGLWSAHHTLFLLLLREGSCAPAPPWGASHGRESSMNISNISPSPGHQSSPNCCILGHSSLLDPTWVALLALLVMGEASGSFPQMPPLYLPCYQNLAIKTQSKPRSYLISFFDK